MFLYKSLYNLFSEYYVKMFHHEINEPSHTYKNEN